jgi:hypothetical protein
LLCAESVELGLLAPVPETVVVVTLPSAVAASLPELLGFAWLVPEVASDWESAEATAPLMALIRSTVVMEHTAARRRLCVTIMNVSPQRSSGVSC